MTHRILAAAIALLFGISMPYLAEAGQKGGFRSSGKATGGGTTSGGGKVSGGGSTAAPRGTSPTTSGTTSSPRTSSRPADGRTVMGTAVPRTPRQHDLFVVTPSIYTPRFFHPRYPSLAFGFGFGIRHLGYGFGPAYYGLGYAPSLMCETTFDCDVVPAGGVVDVPYDPNAPFEPPVFPDPGTGTVRVNVEPVNAQIFVDGVYVGTVEDYRSGDGLPLDAGVHRVEFRATGYEPSVVDMRILAGRRITYRSVLKPLP